LNCAHSSGQRWLNCSAGSKTEAGGAYAQREEHSAGDLSAIRRPAQLQLQGIATIFCSMAD